MSVTRRSGSRDRHGSGHREHRRSAAQTEESRMCVPASLCGLVIGRRGQTVREIADRSGAFVRKDDNPSPIPGMSIFVIRGTRHQIFEAVRLIYSIEGLQDQTLIAKEAQDFWMQWVEHTYPSLESRAYFLPPVFMNRVPETTQRIHEVDVHLLERSQPSGSASRVNSTHQSPRVQATDMAIDAAMGRLLLCLQKMSDKHKEDVFVAISQLNFGDYLGEPCYAPVSVWLPQTYNLSSEWRQGCFDLLIIHRVFGIVVCEVKATGDTEQTSDASPSGSEAQIIDKLRKIVSQLDKAEAMLSYLVSDIAPGLKITKTIALPNLSTSQVERVISGDPLLAQELCRCLKTDDLISFCICSDQLSNSRTPWNVTDDVVWRLRKWWERCVCQHEEDRSMTLEVYKTLLARFCGPATTVKVPCISAPRLCVKTLGQSVSETGERYAHITLFPEQVAALSEQPPRRFLAGPPGTGKTVVLMLVAMQWLKQKNDVYVLSTWVNSRIVCFMLCYQLSHWLKTLEQSQIPHGSVYFLHYNFRGGKEIAQAASYLKAKASKGSVYVIADEVGPDDLWSPNQEYPHVWLQHFWKFCQNLLEEVPNYHLWAANCKHRVAPDGWRVETFTRPLRSPPSVLQEVALAEELGQDVVGYQSRGVPDHTHGPLVEVVYHGDRPPHAGEHPGDCVECGREIGSFLQTLGVGQTGPSNASASGGAAAVDPTSSVTYPPALRFKDVLVLCVGHVEDSSGVVQGLRSARLPVQVMRTRQSEQTEDMEDVATARSDVVWVSYGNVARGIERKVVVCVRDEYREVDRYNRLYPLSRCISQLVLVVPAAPGTQA